MSSSALTQITDEHRALVKSLKKELKAWEHAFLDENGRKPDKQDIAAVPEMAKKYKMYNKLKAAVEAAGDSNQEPTSATSPTRNDDAAEEQPAPPTTSKSSKSHARPPRPNARESVDDDSRKVPSSRTSMPRAAEARRLSQTQTDQYAGSASGSVRKGSNAESASATNDDLATSSSKLQENATSSRRGSSGAKASIIDKAYLISTTSISQSVGSPAASNDLLSSEDILSKKSAQSRSAHSRPEIDSSINYNDISGLPALPAKLMNKKTVATGAMTTADLGQGSLNKFARRAQQQQHQQQRENETPSNNADDQIQTNRDAGNSDDVLNGIAAVPGYKTTGTSKYGGDIQAIPSIETNNMTDSELRDFANRRKEIENIKPTNKPETDASVPLPPPQQPQKPERVDSEKKEPAKTQIYIQSQSTSKVIQVKSYGPLPEPPTTSGDVKDARADTQRPPAVDTRKSNEQLARQPTTPLDPKKSSLDASFPSEINREDGSQSASAKAKGWIDEDDPVSGAMSPPIESNSSSQEGIDESKSKNMIVPTSASIQSPTNAMRSPTSPDGKGMTGQAPGDAVTSFSKLPSILTTNLFLRLPKEGVLRCRLMRRKNLLDKANPTYLLHNEVEDTFMLSARKKLISKSVNFIISDNPDEISKDSPHYLAKLKGNFKRNSFVLTDVRSNSNHRELAMVNYAKNVLPRELQVAITSPQIDETAEVGFSTDIATDVKVKNTNKLLFIKNKPPRWNEATQSHCLNFGGRVTQPSIKNMQLIPDGDENYILLQFGRCGPDWFTLDARWPLTPVEAFAIALTTFDAYDNA